jgi:homoaconitase/3-isopropylmalate dehydratase large subunit
VEYTRSTTRLLSTEGRMTIRNMSIDEGVRVGMIGPDQVIFAHLAQCPQQRWGASVIPSLSVNFRSAFSDVQGFPARNLG